MIHPFTHEKLKTIENLFKQGFSIQTTLSFALPELDWKGQNQWISSCRAHARGRLNRAGFIDIPTGEWVKMSVSQQGQIRSDRFKKWIQSLEEVKSDDLD